MANKDAAWNEWFDAQWDLTGRIDKDFTTTTLDKADTFKAAVCAAIIEHFSEKMRMYLTLPEPAKGGGRPDQGESVEGAD